MFQDFFQADRRQRVRVKIYEKKNNTNEACLQICDVL
jgi:hypothetical protein